MNAIDKKNKNKIIKIYNKNNKYIEKDIVCELYNINQLNNERLLFIIGNCSSYLKISSQLIT